MRTNTALDPYSIQTDFNHSMIDIATLGDLSNQPVYLNSTKLWSKYAVCVTI